MVPLSCFVWLSLICLLFIFLYILGLYLFSVWTSVVQLWNCLWDAFCVLATPEHSEYDFRIRPKKKRHDIYILLRLCQVNSGNALCVFAWTYQAVCSVHCYSGFWICPDYVVCSSPDSCLLIWICLPVHPNEL